MLVFLNLTIVSMYVLCTQVDRLMDLIVNSLYSNREVFLRELVSNASDALDKLRFISLTDPSVLQATEDMEIRIKADKDAGTIIIECVPLNFACLCAMCACLSPMINARSELAVPCAMQPVSCVVFWCGACDKQCSDVYKRTYQISVSQVWQES